MDIEARKEYMKEYRQNNKEKLRELNRNWHKENPDKNKEYKRKYREDNRETHNAKNREYYHNNIEKERERGKLYQKNNPEKVNEKSKRWVRNNPEKAMFNRAQSRAKRKELKFTLILEDIKIPSHCPILGIPLFCSTTGKMEDNSPSLDRIDPNKGYTKDNILVISNRANIIKAFGTAKEHMKIALFMENFSPQKNTRKYDWE